MISRDHDRRDTCTFCFFYRYPCFISWWIDHPDASEEYEFFFHLFFRGITLCFTVSCRENAESLLGEMFHVHEALIFQSLCEWYDFPIESNMRRYVDEVVHRSFYVDSI